METIEKNTVEISIAGKNVTGDVSSFLSKITYTDKVDAESDDISLMFEDTAGKWQSAWYPEQGDTLTVKMGNAGNMLDCGLFEIDEIEYEFPPDMLAVKAIAASASKGLRTKNSKAFEKQSLQEIAQYFADKHGLKLVGKVSSLQEIEIGRKTQDRQTDLSFLAKLAREYGILFSIRGNQLVFMELEELEKQASILIIDKTQMNKGRFRDKTSEVYKGATVTVRNAKENSVSKWSIEASKETDKKDVISVNEKAENDAQAQARAKGALKDANKEKITGSFSTVGNAKLVAGTNIDLTGVGKYSGKWHVVSSTHSVEPSGGYTTDVSIRKIVE